uniref:VWFA and cache domain-containing protein 1-like isoform X1 n=1 Tax=Styela clava TaxID=7725 RepID=UPI001939C968|nr:VWFA and cache domain-containing protein 1-like isoform X1 [Styela clava]
MRKMQLQALSKAFIFSILFCVAENADADASKFGNEIITITNKILGATAFKNHLAEDEKFGNEQLKGDSIVKELANNIENKISSREKAIKHLKDAVIDSYNKSSWGQYTECCQYSDFDLNLAYDGRFLGKVDTNSLCTMKSSIATKIHEVPDDDFLKSSLENLENYPGIKSQYFGSDSGTLLNFPASSVPNCGSYDNRFRPWYVQASAPIPKDTVILIDMSGSMEKENRMIAAIHAANTILSSLTPDDRVAVIGFSDYAYAVGSDIAGEAISHKNYNGYQKKQGTPTCYDNTMMDATPRNIHHLTKAVSGMVSHGGTNYTTGLIMAFKFLYNALESDVTSSCGVGKSTPREIAYSRHRSIIFLSDGKPSDRPIGILDLIYKRNKDMHNSVVLLCYALGKGTFGHFIETMSRQDHVPRDVEKCKESEDVALCHPSGAKSCDLPSPRKGLFRQVTDSQYLRSEMGSYYNYFATVSNKNSNDVIWSVPYYDAGGMGMIVTAASSIVMGDRLVGVVGTDLSMREMMAEVTYFHAGGQASYAFVMDKTGRVLLHPHLPSPSSVKDDPVLTEIGAFERTKEVKQFLESVLDDENENEKDLPVDEAKIYRKSVNTKRVIPQEHRNVETRDAYLSYSCMKIRHLIVCVVIEDDVASQLKFTPQDLPPDFEFLYHRFDVSPPAQLCQYHGSLSSGAKSTVFLAPSSFVNIGKHLGQPETSEWVSELKAYMYDAKKINLGRTPEEIAAQVNLKLGIRDAVRVTAKLDKIWKDQLGNTTKQAGDESSDNDLRRSVIYRYFSSENGMFRIFPGTQMPKTYNPIHRPWYQQAKALLTGEYIMGKKCESSNSGDNCGDAAAVSPPYLDASGAGVVVTITQPIVVSATKDTDKVSKQVVGVMGGDMRIRFLESILRSTVKDCKRDSGFECILIDLAGYVIFDNALAGMDDAAIEQIVKTNYHVTSAHRVIADELVRLGILVRQQCVDVSQVAYLEEYRVDLKKLATSMDGLLFRASHVNKTNTILLIISTDFWVPQYLNQKHCIEHNMNTAICERPILSTQCESPCVNVKEAIRDYGKCTNSFNYTWERHPSSCIPDKFVDERLAIVVEQDGGSGVQNFEIASLSPCFAYDQYSSYRFHTASVHLGAIFVTAFLISIANWILRLLNMNGVR